MIKPRGDETCRNNNEISFCSSREARWDSSDMKVREKFQPRLDVPNSARVSGQRDGGRYLGTPTNGTFCQRLSESLTSCDSAEICKRSVRGRRVTQCFCFESGADTKRESNKEGVTTRASLRNNSSSLQNGIPLCCGNCHL